MVRFGTSSFRSPIPANFGELFPNRLSAGVVGRGLGISASSNSQLNSSTIIVDQFSNTSRWRSKEAIATGSGSPGIAWQRDSSS